MAEETVVATGEANGKEELAAEAPADALTDMEQSIIRQMEYYFGDMNLPRDKFLKEQIKLEEGWVPLSVLLKFNRLNSLTKEPEVIVAALVKSDNQLLEVSEDKQKVRRNLNHPMPELNEERRKELLTRTAYVKGFPKDATIDICLEFFKKYQTPEDIIMRKYQHKPTKTWNFKGSVFVTFKTKEDAASFLKEESVKFDDVELEKMWQSEYLQKKQAEYEEKCSKSAAKKEKQAEAKNAIKLPTGTVLLLSEVPETISRDQIKDSVNALGGEVAFVKLEKGKAWIRLQKENTAKGVFEKCTDSKITVEGADIACALVEGEEENKFLKEMADELVQKRNRMNRHKGGGKQNYGRKRKGGSDNGGHRSKRNK